MSPIPSMTSKLSFGFLKSKKEKASSTDAAKLASTPAKEDSKPAATFDAAAPKLTKQFRSLSIQIDTNNKVATAAPVRVGLPSIEEVAVKRRHSAPSLAPSHMNSESVYQDELKSMSKSERAEAKLAHELMTDRTPAKPYVVLFEEPLPADFNVKVPVSPGTPGKSILKKSRDLNAFLDCLPRIDEKQPLKTPSRRSTIDLANADDGLNGGRLSRTVSFDKHTDNHQKKLHELKETREVIDAAKRREAQRIASMGRRTTF